MRLLLLSLLITLPLSEVQAQPDLDTFLKKQVVQQDVRFEENDKIVSTLRSLDPGQLRIVRNAFFAQQGYVFDDSTLQAYFDKQSWYEADEDASIALSSVEEANVEFIQTLEERAQSRLASFYDKFPPCDVPAEVRLTERTGPVPAAGYTTQEKAPSIPGSGTQIDSFSVEVLLKEDRFGIHKAGCTLQKTAQYRVLLYVQNTAAGGGVSTYKGVTFTDAGRRLSTKRLLEFSASQEATSKGTLTITNDDEIGIEVKQTQIERRFIHEELRKTEEKTTWQWFTLAPNGRIRSLTAN